MLVIHGAQFFDDSLCGLKKLDPKELTYTLNKITCERCMEVSRLEAIQNQMALDTLPHCPHCGERVETVTLTFTVTKEFRFDVMTERDFDTQTIKPMIYGTETDILDTEFVPDKEWQVSCENGHEWFTKRIEPIEDGAQWLVKADEKDSSSTLYSVEENKSRICTICGCDRSEHNWEVHYAEMKAN